MHTLSCELSWSFEINIDILFKGRTDVLYLFKKILFLESLLPYYEMEDDYPPHLRLHKQNEGQEKGEARRRERNLSSCFLFLVQRKCNLLSPLTVPAPPRICVLLHTYIHIGIHRDGEEEGERFWSEKRSLLTRTLHLSFQVPFVWMWRERVKSGILGSGSKRALWKKEKKVFPFFLPFKETISQSDCSGKDQSFFSFFLLSSIDDRNSWEATNAFNESNFKIKFLQDFTKNAWTILIKLYKANF